MSLNPFEEKISYKNISPHYAAGYWETFLNGGFYLTPPNPAETQKARGIFFIMNRAPVIQAAFGWSVPKHLLFKAGEKFSEGSFNFPVFVRPCPIVPRHGFIDSITCLTADEINTVSLETFKVEPEAEFLVTKPIDASYGAILTDGVLTFAVGNDGATSGKNVKYFYLNEDPIAPAIALDPTVLLEGEVPFYELVLDKQGHTNLVQVRSAPGVPKCKDYIPERVEVKKIIKAEGDLLEWEKLMHEVDPATTIVDHTNGSLASHYAIHAIINRVPIFTSYLPNLGDVVEATVQDSEINDMDREKFFRAFCLGFSAGQYMLDNSKFFSGSSARKIMNASLVLSLSCLHNFSSIALAKDFEVVGITLGLFLRTCFTVSAGESRYVPITSDKYPELVKWKDNIPGDRESCYNWQYTKDTSDFIDDIPLIYSAFFDVSWSGAYGGPKWASCTRSSINLFNACVNKDIQSVVELFNAVLHEEHNGGKYLNKIIDVSEFDRAAENPSLYSLKNIKYIIDLLATVWDYAAVKDEKSIPWDKFVPIKYTAPLKKIEPEGRWAITEAKAHFNDEGQLTSVTVKSDKFVAHTGKTELEIKVNQNIVIKESCGCCVATGEQILSPIPYYWTYKKQNILAKATLNKMIDLVLNKKLKIENEEPKTSTAYSTYSSAQSIHLSTQSNDNKDDSEKMAEQAKEYVDLVLKYQEIVKSLSNSTES